MKNKYIFFLLVIFIFEINFIQSMANLFSVIKNNKINAGLSGLCLFLSYKLYRNNFSIVPIIPVFLKDDIYYAKFCGFIKQKSNGQEYSYKDEVVIDNISEEFVTEKNKTYLISKKTLDALLFFFKHSNIVVNKEYFSELYKKN